MDAKLWDFVEVDEVGAGILLTPLVPAMPVAPMECFCDDCRNNIPHTYPVAGNMLLPTKTGGWMRRAFCSVVDKIRPLDAREEAQAEWKDWGRKNPEDALALMATGQFNMGADPEMFAVDEHEELIPAFTFLSPRQPNARAHWYWDGFAIEGNPSPSQCLSLFADGFNNMVKVLSPQLPAGAKISRKNVFEISQALRDSLPDSFVELGCARSFNVYDEPPLMTLGRDIPIRSAGGHVHIGLRGIRENETFIRELVQMLDAVVGVAGVSLARSVDKRERREYYGRAGEFRLPEHGLEYRVLSNFWVQHPAIFQLVFELVRATTLFTLTGLSHLWVTPQEETRRIINECDVEGALASLKANELVLRGILRRCFGVGQDHRGVWDAEKRIENAAFATIHEGAFERLATPGDFLSAWMPKSGWTWHANAVGAAWSTAVLDWTIRA